MSGMEFLKKVLQVLWGTYAYQGLFYMGLLVILCRSRSRWKKLVYSVYSIIVIVGLLNPITIIVTEKIWGTSIAYYCRLFSMIQIIVVIAYALVLLISRFSSRMKLLAVCCIIAVMFIGGNYVYSQDWFEKAENVEKIPNDVKIISEAFEKINDVTIAAPNSLTSYIRQYDASIHMITKRDDDSELARQLDSDTPDVEYIMRTAGMDGAGFIVVYNKENVIAGFNESGYRAWYKSPNYYIYQVSGYEKVKREYNDKEELVSLTYLDAQGNPSVNAEGYVTVRYEYNKDCRVEIESFYDIYGNATQDIYGCYGYKYVYLKNGKIEKKISLDIDGKPYLSLRGYAIIAYGYDSNGNKEYEMFYNSDDEPVEIEKGVYGYRYKYNDNYRIVDIICLDGNKKETICEQGYSTKEKIINEKQLVVQERYYDATGRLTVIKDGYAGITYEYNDGGQLTRMIYTDEENAVVLNNQEYATEDRQYNGQGKLVERRFYDIAGELTLTTAGFAIIQYIYDSSGQRTARVYYNTQYEELWRE